MVKRDLAEWQTEGLRLTAFVVEPIGPGNLGWWEALLGEAPSVSQTRPRERVVTEEGPFSGGKLSVVASTRRIDWRFGLDLSEPPPEFPSVGTYEMRHREFRDLMQRWLEKSPPLNRLAFGAVLLSPVENMPEAYRVLDKLLPSVEIDPDRTRDLIYRINRRRSSRCGIEGLEVNRLSTWGALTVSTVEVEMSIEGLEKVHQSQTSQYACRLEFDINTVPEFRDELDKGKLPALLDELINLGNEIATEGDIP